MSITYAGGGLNLPGALAIDSTGSVWVSNYFGGAVSKFSSAGIPATTTGFAGVGLHESYGITVDGADNALRGVNIPYQPYRFVSTLYVLDHGV